jgi:cell wall-associated NlpC family hydrolase
MLKTIFLTALTASLLNAGAQKSSKAVSGKTAVRFLEDIEVGLGPVSEPVAKSASKAPVAVRTSESRIAPPVTGTDAIESATAIQLKYSLLLDLDVEAISNLPLFSFIESWWGTRYRLGGNDRTGIDCSAFTQVLYDSILHINLPRISRDQYQALATVPPQDLKEGDLVFFGSGNGVSHVGFYLRNNKFVHASTSEGVTISDLNDTYWSRRFVGAGRYDSSLASPLASARP